MAKSTKDLIKQSNKEVAKMTKLHNDYGVLLGAFTQAAQAVQALEDRRPDDPQLIQAVTNYEVAAGALLKMSKPMEAQNDALQASLDALDEKQKKKELKQEYDKVDKIEKHLNAVAQFRTAWNSALAQLRMTTMNPDGILL
jgi:hypothetical protein